MPLKKNALEATKMYFDDCDYARLPLGIDPEASILDRDDELGVPGVDAESTYQDFKNSVHPQGYAIDKQTVRDDLRDRINQCLDSYDVLGASEPSFQFSPLARDFKDTWPARAQDTEALSLSDVSLMVKDKEGIRALFYEL